MTADHRPGPSKSPNSALGRAPLPVALAVALAAALAAALAIVLAATAAAELPPGGTFSDDDGNTHEGMIEAIVAESITNGCDPAGQRYCPADPVTRGQMATFLARAFDLPVASRDYFTDDDGSPNETNINRVAEAGIAGGTAPGTFSPDRAVTRAQMATFLARALGLPPEEAAGFEDVGGPHAGNIGAVAEAGIATGCDSSGTRYCPQDAVRRDQMASFLGRALGLEPIDPPPRSSTSSTSSSTSSTTTTSTSA